VNADAIAEFVAKWDAAAARIRADYAGLTPAQRKAGRSRSPRITEIIHANLGLHHPAVPQISIARLGYPPEACRGYEDAPLADLARAGVIHIISDRMRRPGVVTYRAPR